MSPAKLTRVLLATTLIYVAFAYLWLVVANSSGVSDESRPWLKTSCLLGAGVTYLATVCTVARRSGKRWIAPTLLSAGSTTALGISVIAILSLTGAVSALFHDASFSEGLPPLLAFASLVMLVAMAVGIVVGAIARRLRV